MTDIYERIADAVAEEAIACEGPDGLAPVIAEALRAHIPALAGLNPAAVASLIEAADGIRAWAASLTVCDMNEIVADNGITAGMVVGQEAGEQVRRIDRALTALRGAQ